MVFEHLKHWSYETLEKEARSNLDCRQLTRIDERPGRQDDGTLGEAVGPDRESSNYSAKKAILANSKQ